MQDFIDQYVKVLKHYTVFEGRARRSEFWKFVLVSFVISLVLGWVSDMLEALYALAVLIPSIAVGARRLHDIGKSGWWQLLVLIPVVGWIVLIVFLALDTEPKDNQYGSNPKGGSMPTATPAVSETPTIPTPTV
jgi:uncharacterized membrane protein YhaH (DUF805 family)